MSNNKQLKPFVYEGDILQPVKVLGVTLRARPEQIEEYNAAIEQTKQSLRKLSAAFFDFGNIGKRRNTIDQ